MPASPRDTQRKLLAFAAVVEIATGLVVIIDPAIVVALLFGTDIAGPGIAIGRCFGISLLALGLACWPARQHVESRTKALPAMLLYNALIALYLAWLGTLGNMRGALLWSGVALHALVALLLLWSARAEQGRRQAPPGGAGMDP